MSAVDQVLLGYYSLPSRAETPIQFAINPTGKAWREEPRCAASCLVSEAAVSVITNVGWCHHFPGPACCLACLGL